MSVWILILWWSLSVSSLLYGDIQHIKKHKLKENLNSSSFFFALQMKAPNHMTFQSRCCCYEEEINKTGSRCWLRHIIQTAISFPSQGKWQNKLVVYKHNSGDRAVAACLHTAGVWGWTTHRTEWNYLTLPYRHQTRLNRDYDETSDHWRHRGFSETTRTHFISVVLDTNDPESSGWTEQAELPPLVLKFKC